jgi:choline dehydrogenase-like flavoprotein
MPPFPFSYSDQILKVAFDRLGIPLHHTAVSRNSVAYDGRPQCLSFAMCKTCPILAKWTPDILIGKLEKQKVTVRPNLRVVGINFNKAGTRVESVIGVSLADGTARTVEYSAKMFVIAAHTVESTRLLLLCISRSRLDDIKASLGKYLMEHPVVLGSGELKKPTYPERIGFETAESQYFYESSRKDGGTAFVLVPANSGVESPLDIASEELGKRMLWGEELKAAVRRKFGRGVLIGAMVEQLPYKENRILLDQWTRDDLGFPVPKLTYVLNQRRESRTIERIANLLRQLLDQLGATNIRIRTALAPGHQMGTCRMGNDSQASVVDAELKVHGSENLYAVGSSVFPTSGAIPPTLTIAALALRLGNHLCCELRGNNPKTLAPPQVE